MNERKTMLYRVAIAAAATIGLMGSAPYVPVGLREEGHSFPRAKRRKYKPSHHQRGRLKRSRRR